MTNIIFWNTRICEEDLKSERLERINNKIIELLSERDVNIAIFAEYASDLQEICNVIVNRDYKVVYVCQKSRVKMIVSSEFECQMIRDSAYYFIYSINNAIEDFLLAGVHLPSKKNADPSDIEIVVNRFMHALDEAQEEVGHKKVIITGDFNFSPFEDTMTKADGFHALSNAELVQRKKKRKVYDNPYQMFYNPMWNFLGDFQMPNMTCYYDKGGAVNLYNYILDQVIVSADMLPRFVKEDTKIITETESGDLIENGKPDKIQYSDHLPIFFSLKEEI